MNGNHVQWAKYTDLSPFKPAEWTISPKVIDDLQNLPFDGDMLKHKEWHDLMRDHMLGANHGYGRILFELEREKFPLSFERLQRHRYMEGMSADLLWITKQLWTFMSRHVTKSFRATMKSLVDGQELNGLELWRVPFITNEGGAQQVEVADLGALHNFPHYENNFDLMAFLGEWITLVQEQGQDLPDRNLRTLLLKMTPKDAYAEVKGMNLRDAHNLQIVTFLKREVPKRSARLGGKAPPTCLTKHGLVCNTIVSWTRLMQQISYNGGQPFGA